jgi:hypothetical protein
MKNTHTININGFLLTEAYAPLFISVRVTLAVLHYHFQFYIWHPTVRTFELQLISKEPQTIQFVAYFRNFNIHICLELYVHNHFEIKPYIVDIRSCLNITCTYWLFCNIRMKGCVFLLWLLKTIEATQFLIWHWSRNH